MKRYLKAQVEDYLKDGKPITIAELASAFDCSPETIRKRLKALRAEGKPIIPTQKGVMDAAKVDKKNAPLLQQSADWQVAILIGLALISSISTKALAAAQKFLESPDARKQLRANLLKLRNVVDEIDIDHLLGA